MKDVDLGLSEALVKDLTAQASRLFWDIRKNQQAKQKAAGDVRDIGTRSQVTGGGHLDAFLSIFATVAKYCGYTKDEVFFKDNQLLEFERKQEECELDETSKEIEAPCKNSVTLPGYFRPTKQWDLVVIRKGCLVAAIEVKGIASSFGNNMNNRAEEALGNADDINTSHEEGGFGIFPHRPWIAYLFIIAKTDDYKVEKIEGGVPKDVNKKGSIRETSCKQPHFMIRPEFLSPSVRGTKGAKNKEVPTVSYLERAKVFCEKLLYKKRYSGVGLLYLLRDNPGAYEEPDPAILGMYQLLLGFKNHLDLSSVRLRQQG